MTDTVPEGGKGVSSMDSLPAKLKSRKQQLPDGQTVAQQLHPTPPPTRAQDTANVVFLCTGLLNKTGLGSTQTWQQTTQLSAPPVGGRHTIFKNSTAHHS